MPRHAFGPATPQMPSPEPERVAPQVPSPVYVTEPASSQTPIPELETIATEQDLLSSLERNREALLLGYIHKDFAFVRFEPGNICVQIKHKDSAKVIPMLKNFLFSQTGKHWNISEEANSSTAKTNEEKRRDFIKAEEERILETPFIQQLKQLFPQTTFRFEENVS